MCTGIMQGDGKGISGRQSVISSPRHCPEGNSGYESLCGNLSTAIHIWPIQPKSLASFCSTKTLDQGEISSCRVKYGETPKLKNFFGSRICNKTHPFYRPVIFFVLDHGVAVPHRIDVGYLYHRFCTGENRTWSASPIVLLNTMCNVASFDSRID